MQPAENHILIIYNPAAQGGASVAVWTRFEEFLCVNNIRFHCYTTLGKDDAEYIHLLMKSQAFTVVSIIGGDGTINLAVNALPHFDIPVHLIPAGSGNDLAKMIYSEGIPTYSDIFRRVLSTNTPTIPVDIWKCNDRLFANGFGCGFDGSIAYDTKFKKGIWGTKMKYWVEIVKHIFFYRSPTFTVNGVAYPTFMLSLANGQVYGGDFNVAPLAEVSDGLLDVVRITKVSVLLRFFYLPLVLMGKHLNKKVVSHDRLNRVVISANEPLTAHLDGEPMSEKEYEISHAGRIAFLA